MPLNADDRRLLALCGLLFVGGSALIVAGLILNPPLALPAPPHPVGDTSWP